MYVQGRMSRVSVEPQDGDQEHSLQFQSMSITLAFGQTLFPCIISFSDLFLSSFVLAVSCHSFSGHNLRITLYEIHPDIQEKVKQREELSSPL